jgi:CBS domain-containing protein
VALGATTPSSVAFLWKAFVRIVSIRVPAREFLAAPDKAIETRRMQPVCSCAPFGGGSASDLTGLAPATAAELQLGNSVSLDGNLREERAMIVSEIMSRDPQLIKGNDTVRRAAQLMADCDCGFLPVADDDRLIGTITDRDIALRAIGNGRGPDCPVSEVMTRDVKYCFDDEDLSHVADNMGDLQIRRLPVVDREKRLVGIVSLGDIAIESALHEDAADALSGISRHNHNGSGEARPG